MFKYNITLSQFIILITLSFVGMASISWVWSETVVYLGITSVEKQPAEFLLATMVHFAITVPSGVAIFFFTLPKLCQKR